MKSSKQLLSAGLGAQLARTTDPLGPKHTLKCELQLRGAVVGVHALACLWLLNIWVATASGAWVRNAFPLPESIWSVEALDANGVGKLDLIAMGETKVFALAAPEWKQHVLTDAKEP